MRLTTNALKRILGLSSTRTIDFDNLGKLNSIDGKKILSYLDSDNYLSQLKKNNRINGIITTKTLSEKISDIPIIISKNPKYDFCRLHNYLCLKTNFYTKNIFWKENISKKAIIYSNNISKNHVTIMDNTSIGSGTVIYENVNIGFDVKISSNVIIGEEGAEVARDNSRILNFYHDGGVTIGNNVTIHSLTSIKRGLFGRHTVISSGTTIGSFVNVGHRVKIGKNCFIAPGTILAGSCEIGDNCYLAINSTVLQDVKVGENCKIGAGSVVTKNVPPNQVIVGVPGKAVRKNI